MKPGPKPGTTATVPPERIVRLAQSGEFTTQQCIADRVGLSRERVRQVLKREGVRFGRATGVPLSWPCPECGEMITIPYGSRNRWRHMPAHCRPCARKYCLRGHRREGNVDKYGACRLCDKIWRNRIIRYRTCVDCQVEVPVTYNHDRTAKYTGWKLERCQSCYWRRPRKSHCKRGHRMSGDNLYIYKKTGKRLCRACQASRVRERSARKALERGEP